MHVGDFIIRIYHDARSPERHIYHDARSPERHIREFSLLIVLLHRVSSGA